MRARLWVLVLIAVPALFCFQPRYNPIDPSNPNGGRTFPVSVHFVSDTTVHTLRFSVSSPQFESGQREIFLTAWNIDFNSDRVIDVRDTTDSAALTWFIPQGWQRRLKLTVTVVARDGSHGFDSLVIDTVWKVYTPANSPLPDSLIYAVAVDSNHHIWVATKSSGLIEHYDTNWISQRPENSGYVSTGETKAIVIDRFNNKWIGKVPTIFSPDSGGGVWLLSAQSYIGWRPFVAGVSLIPDNRVYGVGVDHTDRIWCLTIKGTRYGSLESNQFTFDSNLFDSLHGMPNNFCTAVVFDHDNAAWIGTAGKGALVKIVNDTIVSIVRQSGDTFAIYQNRINCMLFDDNTGDIWVGTGAGLLRFDGTQWQQNFTKANSRIPNNQVLCLAQCTGGDLWVGTASGLCRFDRNSRWNVYDTSNSLLPSAYIRALAVEDDHTVWIGTTAGLVKHYYLDQ